MFQTIEEGKTYRIGQSKYGGKSIQCLVCMKFSYHDVDIQEKYCRKCRQFHGEGMKKIQAHGGLIND